MQRQSGCGEAAACWLWFGSRRAAVCRRRPLYRAYGPAPSCSIAAGQASKLMYCGPAYRAALRHPSPSGGLWTANGGIVLQRLESDVATFPLFFTITKLNSHILFFLTYLAGVH